MIEFHHKNGRVGRYESLNDLNSFSDDVLNIRFIGVDDFDLERVSDKFNIDLAFFSKKEDIELSSHYFESAKQLSLHLPVA